MFKKHLELLFKGDAPVVWAWLAAVAKCEQVPYALGLCVPREGHGAGAVLDVAEMLAGDDVTTWVDAAMVASYFNGWIVAGRRLYIFDGIVPTKTLVASKQILVERRDREPVMVQVDANFLFTTGRKFESDRRFKCAKAERLPYSREYFVGLHDWICSGGVEKLREELRNAS